MLLPPHSTISKIFVKSTYLCQQIWRNKCDPGNCIMFYYLKSLTSRIYRGTYKHIGNAPNNTTCNTIKGPKYADVTCPSFSHRTNAFDRYFRVSGCEISGQHCDCMYCSNGLKYNDSQPNSTTDVRQDIAPISGQLYRPTVQRYIPYLQISCKHMNMLHTIW